MGGHNPTSPPRPLPNHYAQVLPSPQAYPHPLPPQLAAQLHQHAQRRPTGPPHAANPRYLTPQGIPPHVLLQLLATPGAAPPRRSITAPTVPTLSWSPTRRPGTGGSATPVGSPRRMAPASYDAAAVVPAARAGGQASMAASGASSPTFRSAATTAANAWAPSTTGFPTLPRKSASLDTTKPPSLMRGTEGVLRAPSVRSVGSESGRRRIPYRHMVCHALFWIKASFAFSLAVGLLSYQISLVIQLHTKAMQDLALQTALDAQSAAAASSIPTDPFNTTTTFPADPVPSASQPLDPSNPAPPNTTCGYPLPETIGTDPAAVIALVSSGNLPASAVGSGGVIAAPVAATLGRVNPGEGVVWWGVEMDWEADSPAAVEQRVGEKMAVVTVELAMTSTPLNPTPLLNQARAAHSAGALALQIRAIPKLPLDALGPDALTALASAATSVNEEIGLPVLLAFGPGMNDGREAFGMAPGAFVKAFRGLAGVVREKTNLTAMVWAPNDNEGYPRDTQVKYSDEELRLMDTNRNGVVDAYDDPYGLYVDWVGLSILPTPLNPATLQYNEPAPDLLYTTLMGRPELPFLNFYSRFSATKLKPLMLSATAMPYRLNGTMSSPTAAEETRVKKAWLEQLMEVAVAATRAKQAAAAAAAGQVAEGQKPVEAVNPLGNLRLVSYVERNVVEVDEGGVARVVDLGVTGRSQVRRAFVKEAREAAVMWGGGGMRFGCNGIVEG
ncbi:hypothetical protein HDU96_000485 [Phlyctochytrium bullatum]|nr:hypothetical protein HDU96_000485 [Phlyctochytrium bullatum]